MHPYPHSYTATATARVSGTVAVTAPLLPEIITASPPQFDGPGGVWSPETLLCAAVADCFALTFRAVCRAANFDWAHLDCRVEGTLERVERVARFTRFTTFAKLAIAVGADAGKARELLDRAEHACLIANSLAGARSLDAEIVFADQ